MVLIFEPLNVALIAGDLGMEGVNLLRVVVTAARDSPANHDQRNQNEITLAVRDRQTDTFIGTTGLYSVNWIMRTAEFRVFLGNKTFWNRGIGTESTKLMVVYGFEKMNLNRIWLGVNTENIGGVHAYEKAGFAKEGILRQEQYRNFRYYDVIRMSILRCEYEKIREGYIQVEHNGS